MPQDKNENHKSLILVYWSGFLLFWTISKLSIEFDMYFPQAFQANASSPGNEQSVNQQIYLFLMKASLRQQGRQKKYNVSDKYLIRTKEEEGNYGRE